MDHPITRTLVTAFFIMLLTSCSANAQFEPTASAHEIPGQAQHSTSYAQAYKICSPAAHQLTKKQCNFGRVSEGYYLQCMTQQGYQDEESIEDGQYEHYTQSYQYCTSIAEQYTKEYCSYGQRYNDNYNRCMARYGYNEYGEAITPVRPRQPAPPADGSSNQQGNGFKFDF